MENGCKIDSKKLTNYIGWGGILTLIQLFFIENINLFSIILLISLNSFLGLLFDFSLGKLIYGQSWWMKNLFHNHTTCVCQKSRDWVKNNVTRIVFSRALISIPILFLALKSAPFITNVDISIKAKILEKKIKSNYISSTISIVGILNKEIIKGKKGNYYKVELKNVTHQEKVLFPTGKYVIDELDDNLLIPLNSFTDSVYNILKEGFDCKLYVRGIADQLGNDSFRGNFEDGYGASEGFSNFYIFPEEGNFYTSQKLLQRIKPPFTNEELPNLRGRFLQKIIEQHFTDINPPEILEGRVTNNILREDRSGFLLMYVDWESNKFTWLPEWLKQIGILLLSILSFNINIDLKKWLKIALKIK